jgi:hypothetical protein
MSLHDPEAKRMRKLELSGRKYDLEAVMLLSVG